MNSQAILLVAFGGPEKFEEVRPFISNVLKSHSVPQERVETVIEQYRAIGGRSPLNEITFQQAEALQTLLKSQENSLKVYVGMRNWTPFMEETLQQIAKDRIKTVRAIILSPFVCDASWTRYQKSLEQARKKIEEEPKITYAPPWYTHPLFIEAVLDRISEGLSRPGDIQKPIQNSYWLFTAHSIPVSMDEESEKLSEQKLSYSTQIVETAKKVVEKFGVKNWSVVYQSRSGNPQEKWLEPDISEKLSELHEKGNKSVFVVPIGFVCDHVEVLYDLDLKAKKCAEDLGIKYLRAKTVGVHPKFIQMLADLSEKS